MQFQNVFVILKIKNVYVVILKMYLSQNQTNVFFLNCILKAAHKAGNYFEKVSSQVENVFVLILKSICHEFKNEYVLILKTYLSKEEEKYQKLVYNRCARCNLCNFQILTILQTFGNFDTVDNVDNDENQNV